ncbi:MAG: YIP1 family protein [Anaerolineae bacterium]|jgi:hypothetical protein|nr:YIP1 family protein [Anaerolineae bacterium]
MTSTHQTDRPETKEKNNTWRWLYQVLIWPKRTFQAIAENGKGAWLIAMASISLVVIILSLVGGPARLRQIQMNQGELPQDFQYWSEDQQNQYFSGQQAVQKPLFIYILPLVSSLIKLWIGWFIFGSILHLLMTFKGSRHPQEYYLNLVAWASMPFLLRGLVQITHILITKNAITEPGLSGFLGDAEGRLMDYVRVLLSLVDIYGIWFLALILIGSAPISGLKPVKAHWAVVWSSLIYIILASLPAFLIDQLSKIGTIQPFIMF